MAQPASRSEGGAAAQPASRPEGDAAAQPVTLAAAQAASRPIALPSAQTASRPAAHLTAQAAAPEPLLGSTAAVSDGDGQPPQLASNEHHTPDSQSGEPALHTASDDTPGHNQQQGQGFTGMLALANAAAATCSTDGHPLDTGHAAQPPARRSTGDSWCTVCKLVIGCCSST